MTGRDTDVGDADADGTTIDDTDGTTIADADGTTDGDRPETVVPDDATPLVCPYCGFELVEETQYRLHLGWEHYDRLPADDRERFADAYRAEEAALNRFRIVALGALVALYFGFLLVYALLAA